MCRTSWKLEVERSVATPTCLGHRHGTGPVMPPALAPSFFQCCRDCSFEAAAVAMGGNAVPDLQSRCEVPWLYLD